MMPFQFVNNSIIDKQARKLIRSHVMKGKNVGKTRIPKRKYPKLTAKELAPTTGSQGNANDNNKPLALALPLSQSNDSIVALTRRVGNDSDLLYFPSSLTPQSMFQLNQLFFYFLDVICPPEFCTPTAVSGWIWFQLIFRDEAYFHCTIAVSSACAAFLTAEAEQSPIALYHLSKTFRLINKKLSSDEALSDSTIAVVTAITIYDRLYGNPQKAMIHLNGASRMIDLRGGISALAKRNFVIAEKTFRADLELAFHCGSKPKFCAQDVPRHLLLIDPSGPRQNKGTEPILYQSVCVKLRDVIVDTLELSHILQEQENRTPKLDMLAFQSTIINLGYQLIEIDLTHHSSDVSISIDNLVHLALISFLITLWVGIGRKLISFPFVAESFRLAARTIRKEGQFRPGILLWVLFMGKLAVFTQDDDLWLIPTMKKLTAELELRTWHEAKQVLHQFPWVKTLHNREGKIFWNYALAQSHYLEPAAAAFDFTKSSLL
ncbi:hypothetical protein F5Y19DRAFT_314858 [Xylariaceae sp. FL1651]|nr:hypothetical protein F5Y19DRAFT_314858 [Xylariaceae sp. FL1651]